MSPVGTGAPTGLPGVLESTRLANGLEVHLLENVDAPVVTVALAYRAGARHDPPGKAGLAHFLEHMMFKGSPNYGVGEIDRLTRSLGGGNNAFTSQDLTTYYFSFGRGVWQRALDIEADRMSALTLAPAELERERAVILEEIASYDAEPWEALERAVRAAFYGEHPYGRAIAGTAAEVQAIERADLEDFHGRFYRPDNAVLVVAGGVGDGALEEVAARFASVPSGARPVSAPPAPRLLRTCRRLRLDRGGVGRLLFWLPAPSADHADFPAVRLLAAVLGLGRSSRLQGPLVEHAGDCAWLAVSLAETVAGGVLQIAAELVPGGSPQAVEGTLLAELERLRDEGVDEAAVARAKRLTTADWVFAHERVEEQAMTLAQLSGLFSPDYAARQLDAVDRLRAEDLGELAGRYLDPDRGAVVGWAVPPS